MLNKKYIYLIFSLCLWLTPVTANPNFFLIRAKSSPDNTTTQDIEHAFVQLVQDLNIQKPLPVITVGQIKNSIEEYEYVYENKQQWFNIKFNKKSVLAYLEKNHLLAKDVNATHTLLLVAQNINNLTSIADMETQAPVLNNLVKTAKALNLNLLIPSMDLIDLALIEFDDLWQCNWSQIKNLAKRYHINEVLLVQIEQSENGNFLTNWHLYSHLPQKNLKLKTQSIEQAIHQAIPQLTSTAFVNNQLHTLRLQIDFKDGQIAYQEILSLIKKFPGVQNVQLDGVTQGSVFYTLNINSSTDHLLNELKSHKNITELRVLS